MVRPEKPTKEHNSDLRLGLGHLKSKKTNPSSMRKLLHIDIIGVTMYENSKSKKRHNKEC
jgi:hypothetical protein